ncbi:glycoside hydrolase family 3 N-terminal domain-containing protein [Reichenbachiella ulvae]|uniref:beta-glucosidase n=1 Tax=Reichenbachiella ulvae TaxID=2980104 RepID=A0ABT3CW00_9BACT|nr:glycoside hydrolase family 3 N-terminal domain-containing protein [Reichenbachiella ulvae]MCV9387418.1 glycoside hydrolase family 3 C-terminal domain-containing protein [Reichenbachiella ulvae]
MTDIKYDIKPFLILISIGILLVSCTSEGQIVPTYKNAEASIEERVSDLLSRMTLEDKCRQIDIWHPKDRNTSDSVTFTKIREEDGAIIKDGIGFLQFATQDLSHAEYAANFNAIQKFLLEETRLGIPAISNGEGCHGFVGSEGTVFPVSLSLGSSWDAEMIEEIYTAVGKEMRAYGITHAATPVLDLLREPRYGRCDEMFGEDPYHVAELGLSAILGLQGREGKIDGNHLIACAKHFGAHGQPEGGTNLSPVNLSERVLRESHFYPFEIAVKKGNIRTVMASYNEIDGVPSHANEWLLKDVLRGEWGFDGYVISDYDAVRRMVYRQHVAHDKSEAGMLAINAGMDFECPNSRENYCFEFLPELIQSGQVKESALDSAVARVLRNKFVMGLFEHPYVEALDSVELNQMKKVHAQLALKAAERSMVLLKNDEQTLPFDPNQINRLAVIGPNADEVHYGTYSNDSTEGVSILEGLKAYADGRFDVQYSEGFKIYENDTLLAEEEKTLEAEDARIREAVALAKSSDAVLLVMGGNEMTSREGWAENRTGDRVDLTLLGRQNDLAQAIFELKKQTAVLLINGRPLAVTELAESAPAIIEGWYLGQQQGVAVANVVFGEVNPSGKLPVTIPRSVGQLPVYYNHKPIVHERSFVEGPYSPLFPFGFGLSYTQFEYSSLELDQKEINPDGGTVVSVVVTNTGHTVGEEIVQMYIRDQVSSVTRPVKELKGFKRVNLKPGESKKISFEINSETLEFYGLDMQRVVEPGDFDVMVGRNSQDFLVKTLSVKK